LPASFNCIKARQPDEKAICASRILSDLDVQMATLYGVRMQIPMLMGERGAAMADTVAPEDHEKQRVPAYGKEGQGRARHAPKPPAQQPERIENEIARTRRDMDETLHELRERLSSRQLRDSAAAKMQATGAIARSHGRGSFDYLVGERPLLLGALGVATGAIVAASMQHREHRNG
jgi:hypothetical protein